MDFQLLTFFSLVAITTATTPATNVTGPPLETVPPNLCVDDLCNGNEDGNYELVINGDTLENHFLQCTNGEATCTACPDPNLPGGPLVYSPECDQCMSDERNRSECYTTEPTGTPLPRPDCPTNTTLNDQQCAEFGSDFCGNRVNHENNPSNEPTELFLMCYNGKYVDCMKCQVGKFYEMKNWKGDNDIYGHCEDKS